MLRSFASAKMKSAFIRTSLASVDSTILKNLKILNAKNLFLFQKMKVWRDVQTYPKFKMENGYVKAMALVRYSMYTRIA